MAFEGLSEKLQNALKKMTGRGRLTEQAVKEGMIFMTHDRRLSDYREPVVYVI